MATTSIIQAINIRLLADTSITTKNGSRLYYLEAPQEVTYPYNVIQEIDDPDLRFYLGQDSSRPRIQIDTIDQIINGVAPAKALDLAIRTRLNFFTGTIDSLVITIIMPGGFRIFRESEEIYRISRDYIVNYERA